MCEFCPAIGGFCCVCQTYIKPPSEEAQQQERDKQELIRFAKEEDFPTSRPSRGGSGRIRPKDPE